MDKHIIAHHRAISATFERFLHYAGAGQGGLQHMQLLDDDLPAMLRDYAYPLHAWPWFISPATKAMLGRCVERIPALIARAIRIEFDGRSHAMASFFGTPEIVAALFLDGMADTRYLIQRIDAVLTVRGLKVLEMNTGSTIGGWQIQWMDQQYRKQAQLADFFAGTHCQSRDIPFGLMTFLVASALEKKLDYRGVVNVLYLVKPDFCERDGPAVATALFEQALRDHGCEGSIHFQATLDGLRFTVEGVYVEGRRISVVLTNSIDAMPPDFFRACFARRVWTTDGPFEHILADKRALAFAYKHKDNPAFDAEERALIEAFIPWGVPLQPGEVDFDGQHADLRTLLLARRDDFVVKIGQGLSGNDVFIGKFTEPADWQAIVERGLAANGWLVQEYCASLPFYGQANGGAVTQFDVVWGIFGFGPHYGGCWLRLMETGGHAGIINSAKGAQEAIVYEVAD